MHAVNHVPDMFFCATRIVVLYNGFVTHTPKDGSALVSSAHFGLSVISLK